MSATTPLSKVEKMLAECAPGYTIRLANHTRVIQFGGKVYRTFPKADPMEVGHVRKIARFFGIQACAAKHFPGIVKVDAPSQSSTKSEVQESSATILKKKK
jgi:hypothetical protein